MPKRNPQKCHYRVFPSHKGNGFIQIFFGIGFQNFKSFGKNVVLRDIDFSVNKGDVTSVIGSSGSGKSTLLRCINLLETPTAGQILFHGSDITARGFHVPAYRAKVGMVFQSFNLFSNMTVLENCMVGLQRGHRLDRDSAFQIPESA